jgi:hypothetical protein
MSKGCINGCTRPTIDLRSCRGRYLHGADLWKTALILRQDNYYVSQKPSVSHV